MPGFILGPHEGPVYDFHGARIVIKASGDDTFGQLGVMESIYPPALLVHPHVHAGEDEMFYLLGGELTGFCEDERWTATAGSFVFVPRDRLHGFTVTSSEPARAIVITVDRPGNLGGSDSWEDAESCQHSGSTLRSCVSAR